MACWCNSWSRRSHRPPRGRPTRADPDGRPEKLLHRIHAVRECRSATCRIVLADRPSTMKRFQRSCADSDRDSCPGTSRSFGERRVALLPTLVGEPHGSQQRPTPGRGSCGRSPANPDLAATRSSRRPDCEALSRQAFACALTSTVALQRCRWVSGIGRFETRAAKVRMRLAAGAVREPAFAKR